MLSRHNLTLSNVYSSFDHRPTLYHATLTRHTSHWGDHYPHTISAHSRYHFTTQPPTTPSSALLQRFDSVIWAPNTSSPGQLRRRSGSHSLRKDFIESFWLTQHLKHVAIRDLITSLTLQASASLPVISEHVNQAPVGGMLVRDKIERSQYGKYHLTSSGRPSRFFPRLLDGFRGEPVPGMFQSAGPNLNAKRDALRLLEDIIERKLPKMEWGLRL